MRSNHATGKDDWSNMASDNRIVDDDYVFCYFMGDNPEHREFAKRLAKKENCKIVALLHLDQYISADEDYVDYAPYNISPADFVNLVKNAKYVCTDSFHGTVFSIIFLIYRCKHINEINEAQRAYLPLLENIDISRLRKEIL